MNSLLEAAVIRYSDFLTIVDARLSTPPSIPERVIDTRVVPRIAARAIAEWRLRKLATSETVTLCFGNLPPLFRIKGRCVVFLQNRYLVEAGDLAGFPLRVRLRIMLERLWLRRCRANVDTFVVQTRSMQQLAQQVLRRTVEVMAFFSDSSGYQRRRVEKDRDLTAMYDFLYAATGEPHKNHVNLLEAWKLLASEGLYPSLCLTVSEAAHPALFQIIEQAKIDYKLNIVNVRVCAPSDMHGLYENSRALVYPSTFESFGLPLVEARQAGLSIIAAELDYVRDLIDPEEVFDPRSPQSIARAIKRFLQISETPITILSSEAFVGRLLAV